MERGYREGHGRGMQSGLETGLAQGRETGRVEGAEAARLEALPRFAGLAAPLDAMLAKLHSLEEDYQTALRDEVVALVAKVAREVIRAELTQNPAQLLSFVDEALATLPRTPKRSIEVSLNPEDLARIQSLDAQAAGRWNLRAEPDLGPGECRIKAGDRQADAGCDRRLAACMDQISAQLQSPADAARAAP